jgi:integrase
VAGLVVLFRDSADWRDDLSESTRKLWRPHLDRISHHFGTLSIKQFDRAEIRPHIIRWRDTRRATPRAADVGIQVLSRLMSFAVDQGLIRSNPCAGIGAIYSSDRAEVIWEPAELDKLARTASREVMWAARLAILTGLRQDDCRTLLWSQVGELAIEKPTGKSRKHGLGEGRKVALIPIYAELRNLLGEIEKRAPQVLTNTKGRPWGSGLSDSFADAARAAGIEKHFHDLRGTAATRLYRADFSLREIAEIMGWEEDRVARIINRYVRRGALLRERIRRLDGGD